MRIWFAPVAIVAFGIFTSDLAISEVRYERQHRANQARLIYSFKALEAQAAINASAADILTTSCTGTGSEPWNISASSTAGLSR